MAEKETDFSRNFTRLMNKSDNVVFGKQIRSAIESTLRYKHIKKEEENFDDVYVHQKVTTGFLEDLRISGNLLIDYVINQKLRIWLFMFVDWLDDFSFYRIILLISPKFYIDTILRIVMAFVSGVRNFDIGIKSIIKGIKGSFLKQNLDNRDRETVIKAMGYPYEVYEVTTDDGYIIVLERLPNPTSDKAIYFQHGILDSAFSWFTQTDNSNSPALLAYDQGYDVFVGTLRGNLEKRHIDPNISDKDYWDFSVNEHAFHDIRAFIKEIHDLKSSELCLDNAEEDEIKITIVAHSMGAMATLMYIIYMGMIGMPHYLSMAILLSPAGVHKSIPFLCRLTGPIISLFLRLFPNMFYSFRIPNFMKLFFAKVVEDMNKNVTTRKLASHLAYSLLGGEEGTDHAVVKTHNLAFHTGMTSTKVFKHFWQVWKHQRFESYDYGTGNMEIYGIPVPIDFTDNYYHIDIPIHFGMGLQDTLIAPKNILSHYSALLRHKPDLAHLKAFPGVGHVDFTVGEKSSVTKFILKTLNRFNI